MALVGFNYECECTSNREQSTTLFSFSPQVFSITWPKKNKNTYFLFQTIILSMNMHVSFFWTPKTRTQRWPTAWITWQRKVRDCCYWSPWETQFFQPAADLWPMYSWTIKCFSVVSLWNISCLVVLSILHYLPGTHCGFGKPNQFQKLSNIFIISSLTTRFTKLQISMRPLSLKSGDGSGKFCQWSSDNTICWMLNNGTNTRKLTIANLSKLKEGLRWFGSS